MIYSRTPRPRGRGQFVVVFNIYNYFNLSAGAVQELYRVEGSLAFLSLVGSFLIILSAMFVKVPRYTPTAAHAPCAHLSLAACRVSCVAVCRVPCVVTSHARVPASGTTTTPNESRAPPLDM